MATTKKTMSKEMLDNIKNYGDEITTLKDFITAVRTRPGMYIGSIGNPGFLNMIREILQNGYDEINKPSSPCDRVWLTYDERNNQVTVEDNGRGIPFDNIVRIFDDQHTSSNYEKKIGEYSSGLHGVGAKVTKALSSKFIVESYILGQGRRVEFNEGYVWKKGEMKIPNKNNKQGSIITFIPSPDAIGDVFLTCEQVRNLAALILPLSKIGAKLYFKGIDSKGKIKEEVIVNKDGILSYMINMTTSPLIPPISLQRDTGMMKMDILITYDSSENGVTKSLAFANTCPTTLGTHIKGFNDGIVYFFTNFMNKTYLAKIGDKNNKKKKTLTITSSDVLSNLISIISVAHLEPIFDGQSKEKLANEDMHPFVKNTTIELLDQWSKEKVTDFNKVCKFLKEMAEIRLKSDAEKIKVVKKFSSSSLTGLPSKYVAPNGKKGDNLELYIVEGDSAGGVMRNNRNNKTQGYFPVRGKIPNAMSTLRAKFLSNPEISGLVHIIFEGYPGFDINKLGKVKYDMSKIKWKYIVLAMDADDDGKHIIALFLRFFILYIPELIESGKLYQAVPPLYGIRKNGKMVYFTDRVAYTEYIQSEFSKRYTVYNGTKKLTPRELTKVTYSNADYVYEIERIANRYSIHPEVLEYVLIMNRNNLSLAKFKSAIKKKYRFLDVSKLHDGSISINGSAMNKIQTIIINDRFIFDCNEILSILSLNKVFEYDVVDGNRNGRIKECIYTLMKLFDKSTPSKFERYKGLGEMDGVRFNESTLDINNRTLMQFTTENVQKSLEDIKYYEDNKYLLLKDLKVTRRDLLD